MQNKMVKQILGMALVYCLSAEVSAQSFLHVEKQDIVDESGEKILLRGVGLGNWMLPEGYMWKFGEQGDRPRRIEKIIADHIGVKQAERFWKTFRKNYITEADIRRIAELGYNSVRPALNARLFLSETPPYKFVNEGFDLLDNLIAWCKKYRLYVIIDMHGAPGGQTGANIDDSPDDRPGLFMDPEKQDLLVKLWVKIAERYKNEPAVAAYDLLNEPLPERTGAAGQYKHLLMPLYQRLIKEIRKVDKKHMFTLEGYDWSNNWSVFDRAPDDNLFFQFHYYCWNHPDQLNDISHFLRRRDQLNTPVWVGETGEKNNAIYFATTQYFEKNNIGWSFWPWKKMDTRNTPYSVRPPEGWEAIVACSQKGQCEKTPNARKIFDELLENIRMENCVYHPEVVNAMLRRIPLRLEAENYGHDGYLRSYSVKDTSFRSKTYRKREPVRIETLQTGKNSDGQAIALNTNEWTAYAVNALQDMDCSLTLRVKGNGKAVLTLNGNSLEADISHTDWTEKTFPSLHFKSGENRLKIEITRGELWIDRMDIK
jgi:hypothetical protein